MKSAAEMSKMIRTKKKAMQDDPDVVDSGGSPSMDLQDEEIAKRDEMTAAMDQNHPMPDAEQEKPAEQDEAVLKRKARLSKMMAANKL